MTGIIQEKQKGPQKGHFDYKIKIFHKSKVDGLKKLSTRAHLFYDFLHFRGYPFTKSQFSQGAINAGFQTKWILTLKYVSFRAAAAFSKVFQVLFKSPSAYCAIL